jgi:rSAM/selenodomain-associated transferase 1
MKKRVLAFAKKPVAGYAKTRLGETTGFEEAAGVYARLLYGCLLELSGLAGRGIEVELCLAAASDIPYFRLAFPEFQVSAQTGADLGERLQNAMQAAFEQGVNAPLAIGTDVPDLDRVTILDAFEALEKTDVVIGPCRDGGYYLIGTARREATLFRDIDWSSARVLQQTEALLRQQGLSYKILPRLDDIDTQADYQSWQAGMKLRKDNPEP